MKKIIIAAIIFFIIAVGIGWYIVFKRPVPTTPGSTDASEPFGSIGGSRPPEPKTPPVTVVGSDDQAATPIPELAHLYTEPVSGVTVLDSKSSTTVRLIERSKSHIYDIDLATSKLVRVSNTTVPKTHEAVWFEKGNRVALRYLAEDNETITSYLAKVVPPASKQDPDAVGTLQGSFLPDNIDALVSSPDGNKLFYLTVSSEGALGTTANADGSKKVTVFDSALQSWLADWPSANIIALTTKPTYTASGILYFLSPTGKIQRILGGIRGLTAKVNVQGTALVYSDSSNNLFARTIKTGVTTALPIQTRAEKCVWSVKEKNTIFCAVPKTIPFGQYPDVWYQGAVHFTDEIYKINTASGTTTVVGALASRYNLAIDATHLTLNPREDYLVFIDENDLSLWGLRLTASTTPTQ